MGDEEHRFARRQPQSFEVEAHLLARQCIERTERLVHQQQRRVVDQRPRDRDPLTHSAGQLERIAVGEILETDLLQHAQRTLLVFARIEAAELDLHEHVFERRAPVEQHRTLEDDAEIRLRAIDDTAVHAHVACARQVEPRDDAQKRALAASRRTDDRQEFAFVNGEIEALDRVGFAFASPIRLGDTGKLDIRPPGRGGRPLAGDRARACTVARNAKAHRARYRGRNSLV